MLRIEKKTKEAESSRVIIENFVVVVVAVASTMSNVHFDLLCHSLDQNSKILTSILVYCCKNFSRQEIFNFTSLYHSIKVIT